MAPPGTTPIVIGVGDVVNRSRKIEDAIEPLQLMLQAIRNALQDTGLEPTATAALQSEIDSLDVVKTWTWPYPDLPTLLAEHLSCRPKRKHYSEHGGNQPGHLFDEAARRISKKESRVAVITGGEALASCKRISFTAQTFTHPRSIRLRRSEAPSTTELDTSCTRCQKRFLAYDPRVDFRCVTRCLDSYS